jgi:hypothetical protein
MFGSCIDPDDLCEQVIKKVGSSPFVLVVESYNQKTGVRYTDFSSGRKLTISFSPAWVQIWILAP